MLELSIMLYKIYSGTIAKAKERKSNEAEIKSLSICLSIMRTLMNF